MALALVFAVGIIFVRNARTKGQERVAAGLTILTAAAFVAGVVFSIVAALYTSGDIYQPRITASVTNDKGSVSLTGDVRAAGLRFDQHMKIRIVPVTGEKNGAPIYLADEGGDTEGLVDVKLALPIAPSRADHLQIEAWVGDNDPDCKRDLNNNEIDLSCLSVALPANVSRPQIAADFSAADSKMLKVTVKQSGVQDDQSVAVRVTKTIAGGAVSEFYSTNVAPASDGTVDQTVQIPVPPNAKKICVAGKVISNGTIATLTCPGDATTAWSQLIPTAKAAK